MDFLGSYHRDIRSRALDICDAPHIAKGQMTLAGFESASDANGMALVQGRMRNRRALAKELGCAPYASQAQLVLSAYAAWGDEYPRHIEGPCMSCVADVARDRMIVARDRMGETQVFFTCGKGGMVFAGHPDMLLRSAVLEPVMDREGLCELFGLGPARTPGKTPLRDLKSLEAGCALICEDGKCRTERYFTLETREHTDGERATVERVRSLLEQSVGSIVHLHPGCMLSGGIDSTALTALLSMRIGRLESFSVDYRDNERDFVPNAFRPEMDAPYIRLAVNVFGTRHHNVVLEQDELASALDRAVRFRGFPGMADIDASLLLFAREIVRYAPNVVSGECGDEVFGGYPWFRGEPSLPEDAFPWSGSMELRAGILRPEIQEKLRLRDYVRDALHASLERYDVSCIRDGRERTLFKLQRLCFDYFMANLQERALRMCAPQGLQVLTPLCDDRLVQYVYNVPWSMKRMDGVEKGLYRRAVQDLLPEKLRMRKKSPYPKTCSAAYTSAVRSAVRSLCADADAPLWKVVNMDCIARLASAPLDPADAPWYGQLMAGPQMLAYLLQVNRWMKERGVAVELD